MGNVNPDNVAGMDRIPRVLYFTQGIEVTSADYDEVAKYRPNVAIRNGAAVGALPMSALEECDAVAGPNIPLRYARTYPNVNEFSGKGMLRMSDLDRPTGSVTDPDNEAKRGAKPPSVGADRIGAQGADRPVGAITQAGGGFVAPVPGQAAGLPMYGSERAENGPVGGTPANPQGLPAGGVTAVPVGSEGDTSKVTTGAAENTQGGFTAPKPSATEDENGTENGATNAATKGKGGKSA